MVVRVLSGEVRTVAQLRNSIAVSDADFTDFTDPSHLFAESTSCNRAEFLNAKTIAKAQCIAPSLFLDTDEHGFTRILRIHRI